MKKLALLLLAICAGCGGSGGGAGTVPSTIRNGGSGIPSPLPSPLPTGSASTRYWIIQGPAALAMANDPEALRYFSDPNHMMILPVNQTAPSTWQSRKMETFTSFAQFQSAVSVNAIDPRTSALIYDNESWSFTPANEQADPATYTAQFASLAHAHGWAVIASHAGANSSAGLDIIAGMCQFADSYSIQSQGTEASLAAFSNQVITTATACRSANPRIKVFAGVSTGPSGQVVTAQQIADAIESVSTAVDGYWLNIPQNSPYCPRCTNFDPAIASQAIALLPTPGP
ncbi:MAG: hypothetical protein M3N13_05300 [Candidatus Eremiobacteraeota bacterium]|nr:hypothetical protein [Candidatus Eremiobacteraeota bacterium]